MWMKIRDFFKGVVGELRRVSWTSRKELVGATAAVLVLTIIMASFIFGIDTLFDLVLRNVLKII